MKYNNNLIRLWSMLLVLLLTTACDLTVVPTPNNSIANDESVFSAVEQQLIATFDRPAESNGDPLILYGQVVDVNGAPVSDAVIEIWQTDQNAIYDHPDEADTAGRDMSFQFYGSNSVDEDGWYAFRTIVPAQYNTRPRHIHFKVKQDDNTLLTSQLYWREDPDLERERMFRTVGDRGELMLLDMVQDDGTFLAKREIVVDTGIGTGILPLTPSQIEGPYYPVVDVSLYDNDLTILDAVDASGTE